jgi:dTDP-4-dehydrorhamnose 3,5-epimerase-like enzyme
MIITKTALAGVNIVNLSHTANAEMFYQISRPYTPDVEVGMRWDDPDLAIGWPVRPTQISDKGQTLRRLGDIAQRIGA